MPAANRIRPLDVFSQAEWANLSTRQPWRGPLLVVHAWAIIFAAMAMVAIWPNPLTIILAIMLVGARQLGLAILMHEAAHGALHPNRRINDFLGHWLGAAPVGASLESYRTYHLNHHRYVQQPEDPDLVLSAPFPTSRASVRRKFIRDLTGQTFLKQRFGVSFESRTANDDVSAAMIADGAAGGSAGGPASGPMDGSKATIVTNQGAIIDHLLVNLLLFALLAGIGFWWIYPLIWIGALATWFPFVTRLRNIGEHAGIPNSDDPLAHARTTYASWWERLLIAPYWVHYHSEHHAFMHLPCYRLKAAHQLLIDKGHGHRIARANGYSAVLRAVIIPN